MAKPKRKFPAKPSAAAAAPRATPASPEPAPAPAPKPAARPAPKPVSRARPAGRADTRPEPPLARADLWTAAGLGAVAAALFASTFSSQVALGDSPESITGVRSLGILHAPGYATYVIAARVFGEVFRVGTWALRVNLFSLVCATLTIALLFVVARGFGADRIGAAVGSLALAASAAFWFNAGFAKYYAFSSLLLVVVVLCVQRWERGGSESLLVVAGVITGACLGVSWVLAAVTAVGLIGMLWLGTRRPRGAVVIATAGAAVLSAIAVCVYILVRAGQDPTINFGHASTVGRLRELLSAADFSVLRSQSGAGVGNFVKATPMYVGIVARDAGLGAALLALVGIFDVWDRKRRDHGLFFAVLGLGSVVAVGVASGFDTILGFYTGLVMGGQLVGVFFVVAVLAALGISRIGYEAREWRTESRRAAGRPVSEGHGSLEAVLAVIAVAAVVVPSVIVHHRLADHRMPPMTERYAARVLSLLPRNSVLLSGGYEVAQPIIERQQLRGARPDVTVVSLDILDREWYRSELVDRLGLDPALARPASASKARAAVVAALRKLGPVYEDAYAMFSAPSLVGYQPEGLVGRVVDGSGPQGTPDLAAKSLALRRSETQDGVDVKYARFPNGTFYFLYERAHVELAKADALADDLDGAADEIERGLRFGAPHESRLPITEARKHSADAKQLILGL